MTLPEAAVTTLPLILPLSDAAREMGVDEAVLRDMVQSGKIRAFTDPEGNMYIQMTEQPPTVPVPDDDINARLSRIKREDFAHLEGVPITVSEAARKYGVSPFTIQTWKRRYPHVVEVLTPGHGRRGAKLNEAAIAYLVAIYRVREKFGLRSGTSLVDTEGNPTLIKHPELSIYRRMKK